MFAKHCFPKVSKGSSTRLSSEEAAHGLHVISSLSLAQPLDFSTARECRSLPCCLPTLQMWGTQDRACCWSRLRQGRCWQHRGGSQRQSPDWQHRGRMQMSFFSCFPGASPETAHHYWLTAEKEASTIFYVI